jgi:hypothetical protein
MSAKVLTKDRQAAREADSRFPNERIRGCPIEIGSVDQVRRGDADVGDVPWINKSSVPILRKRRKEMEDDRFDPSSADDMREYASLLQAAANDPAVWNEVAAYRTFVFTNDVMASPFALSAFQTINFSADELPLIERPRSRNLQRFTVRSHSLDGGTLSQQWRPSKTIESFDFEMIATDKVEYTLMDLQQGNVSAAADIDRELAYDMEMKVDELAKAQLDAAQTASGLRALLSIHPKVVLANIPDKNYLDLTNTTTYGPANVFTLVRLKAVLNHIALFGAAYPDQAMSIQTILCSPQNMRDAWDYVELVSGFNSSTLAQNPENVVPKGVRDQIFSTGMMTSAWGMTWNWTPNSQLDKGRMYVLTNQPLGWFFTKSEFDKMIRYDATNSPQHAENNIGEVFLQRAIRFFVPDLWKYRVVIIDF